MFYSLSIRMSSIEPKTCSDILPISDYKMETWIASVQNVTELIIRLRDDFKDHLINVESKLSVSWSEGSEFNLDWQILGRENKFLQCTGIPLVLDVENNELITNFFKEELKKPRPVRQISKVDSAYLEALKKFPLELNGRLRTVVESFLDPYRVMDLGFKGNRESLLEIASDITVFVHAIPYQTHYNWKVLVGKRSLKIVFYYKEGFIKFTFKGDGRVKVKSSTPTFLNKQEFILSSSRVAEWCLDARYQYFLRE